MNGDSNMNGGSSMGCGGGTNGSSNVDGGNGMNGGSNIDCKDGTSGSSNIDCGCSISGGSGMDCGCGCSAPPMSNAELTQEFLDIMARLNGDIESRRKTYAYMQDSTAIVHHQVVASSFVPRLFNEQTRDTMKYIAETAHRILVKVIERYLEDAEYRAAFTFDPRLEELILLPRGYASVLPFARVDTFLDEETYLATFCEFNGDGSSGMNENREITVSVAGSQTFRTFVENHHIETCELFHAWVEKFVEIYRSYEHAVEEPRFAIVDYLENGVVDEFKLFKQFFRIKGYPCEIVDVRDLSFDGRRLRDAQGFSIDAIWRRCVTNDVIEHWDESQALIEAVRMQKVALIGSFAGHIVHDKQIFHVLHDARTQAFLTDEERFFVQETVPYTAFLTPDEIEKQDAHATKDAWIVKPSDHYGADQVYAGCALTQDEWDAKLDELADGSRGTFILQRYVTPFKTLTLPPDTGIDELADDEISSQPVAYNNINGLYLYDGEFVGVFSRLGPLPTISKDMQGMTAATVWVMD